VLYESYIHPITVLSTLPSAGVGAVLALMIFHIEFDIIALIARYHRRATPKKDHPGYGELPHGLRQVVKVLAACLRLAEGLDRSHAQAIDSLRLVNRGDDYLLQLRTGGDAELELWAAGRHVEPFEEMLKHPIRFEVAAVPAKRKAKPA